MKGQLIILMTKGTLDEIFYYASRAKEKRMYNALENIKNNLENNKPLKKEPKPRQKTLF